MKGRFVIGSERNTVGRRRLLLVTLLAVILIAIDVFTGGVLRGYVRALAAHIWTSGSVSEQAVENTGWFATHSRLAHDNASLRAELARYQDELAASAVVRDENDQLRAMVHIASIEKGITAAVVSSLSASPYGTFLISATPGQIVSGDLVLSDGGFVVGRIADVGNSTALVNEIFASDASIDGLVVNTPATINGTGGGNARTTLPRAVKVVVGDVVIAPTLGQRPIGVVGSIESDAASADQKVFLRVPVNLGSFRYVYVVRTP